MLADGAYAALLQALHQGSGEIRDGLGFVMESTIADDAAVAVVDVEYGREAQVDAVSAQLGRQHESSILGELACMLGVAVPHMAERTHWRQHRKARAKPLHSSAFMVDADEKPGLAKAMDLGCQRGELLGRAVVAREENHASGERMHEPRAILAGKLRAGDVDDRGTERNGFRWWQAIFLRGRRMHRRGFSRR